MEKFQGNSVAGFEVCRKSGSSFVVRRVDRGKKILQVGTFLYFLAALCISAVILTAYFKGARIFDGNEMSLWFVSVFIISEWFPLLFLMWFAFSVQDFVFDYTTFEMTNKNIGLVRTVFSVPKHKIQKLMLISQSDDSSICALKIQIENAEQKILWLQPYEQCQWLGNVISSWAGVPLEE